MHSPTGSTEQDTTSATLDHISASTTTSPHVANTGSDHRRHTTSSRGGDTTLTHKADGDGDGEDKSHPANTTTPAPFTPTLDTLDGGSATQENGDVIRQEHEEEEQQQEQQQKQEVEDHEISEIKRQLSTLDADYTEHQTEWFFLENQGCLMDYAAWKKICTSQLQHYLNACTLENLSNQRQRIRNLRKSPVKALPISNVPEVYIHLFISIVI